MVSNSLMDTINLMISTSDKDRIVAEYIQTKIRYEKLCNLIIDYYSNRLFALEVKCPIDILVKQAGVMREYLNLLQIHMKYEDIRIYEETNIEYFAVDKSKINLDDTKGEDHGKRRKRS